MLKAGQYVKTKQHRDNLRKVMLGRSRKPFTDEHRANMSKAIKKVYTGRKGGNYKGGVTPTSIIERNCLEYKKWRLKVFERDNYTCQICFQYNGHLHADHIEPFSTNPKLRFDIDNGRTLCRPCHYYVTFKQSLPQNSKWGLTKYELNRRI